MNSIYGQTLQISLFGESHGQAIGCTMSALPAGIALDEAYIQACLSQRRAKNRLSTARQEEDRFEIVSGFFNGFTTGSPLTLLIYNQKQSSKDYEKTKFLPRPSHADYTAQIKYGGYQDYRGGGHFSGRITAPLVAAGAICRQILTQKGITIGTHLLECACVRDDPFDEQNLPAQLTALNEMDFAALSKTAAEQMQIEIEKARLDGDSVGGILETAVIGLPAGIGKPFFDSVESTLAHLLFSIPAVKGVEFGLGFDFAAHRGSQVNDAFCYCGGQVQTRTNYNAGINGGITNGMPVIFRTVVKPTASIYQEQQTVDLQHHTEALLQIQGRHDPAIVHRARAVQDAVTAIGLLDLSL